MGFGPHWKTDEGIKVFNVFSGIDEPQVHAVELLKEGATFGFNNDGWIRGISTHEFGHSFVNEPLFVYRDQLQQYQHLQKTIRKKMKRQGYWDWETILAEHLVRVGEIRIADRLGLKQVSNELFYDYYIGRKFIYLPHFLAIIRQYEETTQFASFKDFLPQIVASIAQIDAKKALKDWKKAKQLNKSEINAPIIQAIHPTKRPNGQYTGIWNYQINDTPFGDIMGRMNLQFNNGIYEGSLENNFGKPFKMYNLQFEENQFFFETNIENTQSSVSGAFEGDNFSGKITVKELNASFNMVANRTDISQEQIANREIPIITSDINLFWECFDRAKPNFDTTYFAPYLENGSQGVKDFIPYRIISAKALAQKIKEETAAYEVIRSRSLKIEADFKKEIKAIYQKLKEVYAPAVYAPAYFVIGRFNSGGTASSNGIIMGVEMMDKIGYENFPDIVAHELIHFQQNYPNTQNLLAQCINEGSADLLGFIIHEKPLKHHLDDWCLPRAKEIWAQFQKEKHQ